MLRFNLLEKTVALFKNNHNLWLAVWSQILRGEETVQVYVM